MEIWQDEDESWEEDRESAAVTDEEGEDDGDEETEQSAARLPARIILILSRRSTDSMQSCVARELRVRSNGGNFVVFSAMAASTCVCEREKALTRIIV